MIAFVNTDPLLSRFDWETMTNATYGGQVLPIRRNTSKAARFFYGKGKDEWVFAIAGDLYADSMLRAPADFHCKWGSILKTGRFVWKGIQYAWDGCTGVWDGLVDKVSKLPRTIIASLAHDFVYQFAKEIARCWHWTHKQVLKWADEVFLIFMRNHRVPWLQRRLYYRGVRLLGYPFTRTSAWWREVINGQTPECKTCPDPKCGKSADPAGRVDVDAPPPAAPA